jgi:hypothetical protein
MVTEARRRQVDPKIAARWKALTADPRALQASYDACAEEDRALANAGLRKWAAGLARIDAGDEA